MTITDWEMCWIIWKNGDNNRLPLHAFFMNAVKTIIEDNEIMENAYKVQMLTDVLAYN